jgi:putative N6-adenine-specific DNA methylase
MAHYTLIATSAFGIESVVADELRALGYTGLTVENGRVKFNGDLNDLVRCNIRLRTADRVLLEVKEFIAKDFEELFQGTLSVPWDQLIPENGKMHVTGKSIKSTLFSVPDCQSIVKKAVVETMKKKYKKQWFDEDGPVFKIEIALLKDRASLTIDTSGPGLHKRGYRISGGEAPLRETLAAAMVMLSRWDASRILADPLCGSGTIAIEAALLARNIAPGLNRSFVSEEWPLIPKKLWKTARDEARGEILDLKPVILASDMDGRVLRTARENADQAGVSDCVTFQRKPVSEFSTKKKYGCLITNPPYGERLGDLREAEKLYAEIGEVFSRLDTWSCFIISPHEDFARHFGKPSTRNRKLYNGRIKCYLHQYFGPLPRVKNRPPGDKPEERHDASPESVDDED